MRPAQGIQRKTFAPRRGEVAAASRCDRVGQWRGSAHVAPPVIDGQSASVRFRGANHRQSFCFGSRGCRFYVDIVRHRRNARGLVPSCGLAMQAFSLVKTRSSACFQCPLGGLSRGNGDVGTVDTSGSRRCATRHGQTAGPATSQADRPCVLVHDRDRGVPATWPSPDRTFAPLAWNGGACGTGCPSRRPPVVRQTTVKQGWLSPARGGMIEGGCSTGRMPKSKSQGRVSDAHHPSDPQRTDPPRLWHHDDGQDARMLWRAGVAPPRCVNSSLRWDELRMPSAQRLRIGPDWQHHVVPKKWTSPNLIGTYRMALNGHWWGWEGHIGTIDPWLCHHSPCHSLDHGRTNLPTVPQQTAAVARAVVVVFRREKPRLPLMLGRESTRRLRAVE